MSWDEGKEVHSVEEMLEARIADRARQIAEEAARLRLLLDLQAVDRSKLKACYEFNAEAALG